MLFPKSLFLETTFPKIDKNSIFLLNFYQKISEFSQTFPTICIFRPKTRNINAGYFKILLRIANIMHFLLFSQEIFENFLKNSPNNYVFRQNAGKFNTEF